MNAVLWTGADESISESFSWMKDFTFNCCSFPLSPPEGNITQPACSCTPHKQNSVLK